jgi:hypothetical protein
MLGREDIERTNMINFEPKMLLIRGGDFEVLILKNV